MPRPVILKKLSWRILGRPTRTSRTNTPQKCPFHYRGLEYKSRKPINTWRNRQIWPWSTNRNRAKANRVLPREHTGHSKHLFPVKQENTLHMDIIRWSIPKSDWLYSLQPKREKFYTVSKNKTRSWLWHRPWTPYAKFRLKLKKVGKTIRPFRYDLNQIPYNYTVEVRNRFRGLDLIDRVPEELWTKVHDIVQEAVIKTIPKKKKCKRAKWLSEKALKLLRKEAKGKGIKGKIYPFECRVSKNSKER